MYALISIKKDGEMKIESLHLNKIYLEKKKKEMEENHLQWAVKDIAFWENKLKENNDEVHEKWLKEQYQKALEDKEREICIIKRIVLED